MWGRIVRYQHRYYEVECEFGRISLVSSEYDLFSRLTDDKTGEHGREHIGRAMRVSFLPTGLDSPRMVVASAFHEAFPESSSCISHLAVNRVIPAGSRVFTLVLEGRLQELREMFARGEASIRDHDEEGASLLMVSSIPDIDLDVTKAWILMS